MMPAVALKDSKDSADNAPLASMVLFVDQTAVCCFF
jgi:hypothetical protein